MTQTNNQELFSMEGIQNVKIIDGKIYKEAVDASTSDMKNWMEITDKIDMNQVDVSNLSEKEIMMIRRIVSLLETTISPDECTNLIDKSPNIKSHSNNEITKLSKTDAISIIMNEKYSFKFPEYIIDYLNDRYRLSGIEIDPRTFDPTYKINATDGSKDYITLAILTGFNLKEVKINDEKPESEDFLSDEEKEVLTKPVDKISKL